MKSFLDNPTGVESPTQLERVQGSKLVAGRIATFALAIGMALSACTDTPAAYYEREDADTTDYVDTDTDEGAEDTVDSDLNFPDAGDSTSIDSDATDLDLPPCDTVLRPDFVAAMATAEAYANKIYTVQPGQQNRFFDLPLQLQGWRRLDDAINVSVNSQGVETTTVKTTYERVASNGQRSLLQAYYQIGSGLNMAPAATRANFSSEPDDSLTGNLVALQVTTNAIEGDPLAANHQFQVVSVSGTPFYCEIKHADGTLLRICLEDCLENLSGVVGSTVDQQADHPDSRFFD